MEELFTVVGALIAIGSIVGTAVWAVSKISSTTAVLGTKLDHLAASMTRLDSTLELTRAHINTIDTRLTVVERSKQVAKRGGED